MSAASSLPLLLLLVGTFKHQKVELRNQGISPAKCLSDGKPDPIFRCAHRESAARPSSSITAHALLAVVLSCLLIRSIADGEKTYTRFSQAEFNAMSSAAPRSKL